jgi:predicted dehydrogenase
MPKIAMLGSGFIARFYADSILGQRSRDSIVSVYSRSKKSAEKFAATTGARTGRRRWRHPSPIPKSTWSVSPCPITCTK